MSGVDPLMVGEHKPLVVGHDSRQAVLGDGGGLEALSAGVPAPEVLYEDRQTFPRPGQRVGKGQVHPLGLGIGEVAQAVDTGRDRHKAQGGKEQRLDQPGGEPGSLFSYGPSPPLGMEADKVEYRQARRTIDHRPFAGRPDPPEEPGEKEGQGAPPERRARREGQIAVKEEIHQQNEKDAVGVDGGDTGLGEVHEVEGKQTGTAGGHRRSAEEIFQKHVEDGEHADAEKGPHKAPAEGGHAKDADPQTDDELAQRRMGDLVGINALQMLQSGAGVIDLIKVGGIVPSGLRRNGVLLVKKGVRPGYGDAGEVGTVPGRQGSRGDVEAAQGVSAFSDGAIKSQLSQLQETLVSLAGETEIADVLRVLRLDLQPLEEIVILLGQGVTGGIALGVGPVVARHIPLLVLPGPKGVPSLPVCGDLQIVASGPQVGEVHQLGKIDLLRELELHGAVVPQVQGRLWGGEGAQPEKGAEGVKHGDQEQREGVPPLHGVQRKGKAAPGTALPQGDPLHAAPARAAGGAIGGEEEDDPQQYHQGKGHAGKTGIDILPEAGLQVLREVGHRTPPRLSKKGVLSMGNRGPCGRGG